MPRVPETFDPEFIRFVWDLPGKNGPHIAGRTERFGGHLCVTRLGNDRDAAHVLAAAGLG
jgi:hypothetical protein